MIKTWLLVIVFMCSGEKTKLKSEHSDLQLSFQETMRIQRVVSELNCDMESVVIIPKEYSK
jgi:hypothetical protein